MVDYPYIISPNSYKLHLIRYMFIGGTTKKISLEVARYITAIEESIVASQHGHTIATEAIDFATYITQIKTEKVDGEKLKNLNEYLEKNSKLVEQGYDSAAKALEGFRDVRRTLNIVSTLVV